MTTVKKLLESYEQTGSYRQTARELGVSHNTVRKYVLRAQGVWAGTVEEIVPHDREIHQPARVVTPEIRGIIHRILEKNRKKPRKQRCNAKLIWRYLCASGYLLSYDCRRSLIALTRNKRSTCRNNGVLRPKECCAHVITALDHHLTIPIQGKLTQIDVFGTVVGMAAMNQSIHSITGVLEHVPCETSLRYHLKKLDMDELEEKNAAILAHMAHKVLKPGKAYEFAIDYTNDPYYGAITDENDRYVLRSRRKQSTNEFYSYVTLYVTIHDRQMTLAIYPVQRGISKVGYIARCLDQIYPIFLGLLQ